MWAVVDCCNRHAQILDPSEPTVYVDNESDFVVLAAYPATYTANAAIAAFVDAAVEQMVALRPGQKGSSRDFDKQLIAAGIRRAYVQNGVGMYLPHADVAGEVVVVSELFEYASIVCVDRG